MLPIWTVPIHTDTFGFFLLGPCLKESIQTFVILAVGDFFIGRLRPLLPAR